MSITDLNQNGELDFTEWIVATAKRQDIINESTLKQAFVYFNKYGSGKISLNELKEAMGPENVDSGGQELDNGVW